MRLRHLATQIEGVSLLGDGDPDILCLAHDHRKVEAGALFAALRGARADGQRFVPAALEAGAVAVLAARQIEDCPVPVLVAPDPLKALAEAAAIFHGHPSRGLSLVGVTGTNGKSTVAYILRHLLRTAGRPTGLLGTIEYDTGTRRRPAPLTTPDALVFTASLAEMAAAGCAYAVAEVSSHALTQARVHGHVFAGAVFTNLTRDHLDYHDDMDRYLAAKKILFDELPPEAFAVANADDPAWERMVAETRASIATYGIARPADLRARIVDATLAGTRLAVAGAVAEDEWMVPLAGQHNVENALAAALAALHLGLDAETVRAGLASFPGVPGRLERFVSGDGVTAFVDYAHTDDALRRVLRALRPLTEGRLLVVFGCGGDRDRGKRPLMAGAAESAAELVYVTSDNPRTESPEAIVEEILAGMERPAAARVHLDRRQAIEAAVAEAVPGDVILVAGKGHEDYQIRGTERHHFDDREEVSRALRARSPEGTNPCA